MPRSKSPPSSGATPPPQPASKASAASPGAPPPVIGLTGGIASGKSTVSRMLAARGAHVIDADGIGHQVIEPSGAAYPEVVAAFGPEILAADGTISRPKLGALIFADPALRTRLNGISHPRMAERMRQDIERVRLRPLVEQPPAIVLDAAILFEAGWDALCDTVWTVEAPRALAVERLMARSKLERTQAEARVDAQLTNAERAQRARHVLRNEGTLEALEAQVERLWSEALADPTDPA